MSKHVLLNRQVIELIAKELIDTEDSNQYCLRSTKWMDGTKSPVLYVTEDDTTSPPILTLVQRTVDDSFLHCVLSHCESVYKEYGTAPVVLIFVTEKIHDSIKCNTTKDLKHPFLLNIQCFPWAKKCFFLNNQSIYNYLTNTPLPPLVALGTFLLLSQKKSLVNHDQKKDPIIQMLYDISEQIMEDSLIKENKTTVDLLYLCDKSESKIKEGIGILKESSKTSSQKRAIDCLNDSLELIKSYKLKYRPDESSYVPSSPVPTSSPDSPDSQEPSSSPEPTAGNWEFIDNYKLGLGDSRMNWKACFEEGRSLGFLYNYTSPISVKNAYQRWKKQQE